MDYLPQVHVEAIKGANKKAVAELTKYPAKVTSVLDLPTADAVQVLADLTRFCRNRRFVSFGGCFKTAKPVAFTGCGKPGRGFSHNGG